MLLLGGILLMSLCCWGYTADVFVLLWGGGGTADVFVLLGAGSILLMSLCCWGGVYC